MRWRSAVLVKKQRWGGRWAMWRKPTDAQAGQPGLGMFRAAAVLACALRSLPDALAGTCKTSYVQFCFPTEGGVCRPVGAMLGEYEAVSAIVPALLHPTWHLN